MNVEAYYNHLVEETRKFLKEAGFTKVLLGVSGGLDSAMVATIAADAIGGENVYGIAMPSEFSSNGSLTDAEELMQNLGGNYRVQPIEPMFAVFKDTLNLEGVAVENIQARIRGMILMSVANMEGQVVLATGNKSEALVGYCTMYGDTVGGFDPIGNVYKTDLYKLALYRAKLSPSIPWNTIEKPPSAELAPGQKDSNELPTYDMLDAILRTIYDDEAQKIPFDPRVVEQVKQRVKNSSWKRAQLPPLAAPYRP